jgi:hypothetical protein
MVKERRSPDHVVKVMLIVSKDGGKRCASKQSQDSEISKQ